MATKERPDSQPPANRGGRPSALNSEHIAALHEIVSEHAQASLAEIAAELPITTMPGASRALSLRRAGMAARIDASELIGEADAHVLRVAARLLELKAR